MKRIILILSLVVMAAALLISPGANAESIGQILDRYYACDNSYTYNMTHSPDAAAGDCRWGTYSPTQCAFLPSPEKESCIEDYRVPCLQNAFSNHLSCVGDIESHREMENFCDHAREIRDFCNAAYYVDEDIAAWSSCLLSSGISQCE